VLGVDGLIVSDASIMPSIPRANTNLTTAAIAERIAQMLSEPSPEQSPTQA
jgi:choline dehydrogenase-like flavoprotein